MASSAHQHKVSFREAKIFITIYPIKLGRGRWWFQDPIENVSFITRVLATGCIHLVHPPHHQSKDAAR